MRPASSFSAPTEWTHISVSPHDDRQLLKDLVMGVNQVFDPRTGRSWEISVRGMLIIQRMREEWTVEAIAAEHAEDSGIPGGEALVAVAEFLNLLATQRLYDPRPSARTE